MTLNELRYVVAVAEHRHFGKAARACCISQPTLSTQIKKLEEQLGVVLFERTNKRQGGVSTCFETPLPLPCQASWATARMRGCDQHQTWRSNAAGI